MQVRPFTWLALSFFGYYCAYGVFLPPFPAWLKTQSYSEESIGLLLACAYIFRFSGGILFSGSGGLFVPCGLPVHCVDIGLAARRTAGGADSPGSGEGRPGSRARENEAVPPDCGNVHPVTRIPHQ